MHKYSINKIKNESVAIKYTYFRFTSFKTHFLIQECAYCLKVSFVACIRFVISFTS